MSAERLERGRFSRRVGPAGVLTVLLAVAACGPEDPEDILEEHLDEMEQPEMGAAPLSGDAFQVAEEMGQGRVTVVYVPADGFAYEGDDGRLTGVTVEILRDFANWVHEEHEFQLELDFQEETDWSRFYDDVRDAEEGVFGIGNVTITDERWEEIAFSPPYMTNVAVLISHEDVPELESMADIPETFQGMTAVPFEGTLHEERILEVRDEHWPELEIEPVDSNDAIIERVASGDGYFGWIDIYNYWRERDEEPLRRHPVGDDAAEEFGIIMPLGSDWVPEMEAFFLEDGEYVGSQRYRDIMEAHLGEELAAELEEARRDGSP